MNIERRSGLSYEQFMRDYAWPRKPVIITDALDACPARDKWTPQYFRDRFGEREVRMKSGMVRMRQIIDGVLEGSGKTPFLRESPLSWWLPEAMADLAPFPAYVSPNWLSYPFARRPDVFRSGYASHLARAAQTEINLTGANMPFGSLHLDLFWTHAMIMQWCGAKKFFIFPLSETPYLYRHPHIWISQIEDVEHADLERFPAFAKARMIEFTLHPGEVYFNPTGWWHTTRTLDVSIATVVSFANASNWNDVVAHLQTPDAPWKSRLAALPFQTYLRALGLWILPHHVFPEPTDPAWCCESLRHFQRTSGRWAGPALGGVPEEAALSKYG